MFGVALGAQQRPTKDSFRSKIASKLVNMWITSDVSIFPAVDSVTASRHCVMYMCVPVTEARAALGEIDAHATRHKLCF